MYGSIIGRMSVELSVCAVWPVKILPPCFHEYAEEWTVLVFCDFSRDSSHCSPSCHYVCNVWDGDYGITNMKKYTILLRKSIFFKEQDTIRAFFILIPD